MRFEKMAALGAVGACFGIAAIYAFLVWVTMPHPVTAGIDRTGAAVVWIALGVVVAILIAAHLALGHQLWHGAKTDDDL